MKDIHPNDMKKIMDHAKQIYCAKIASGLYQNNARATDEINTSISLAVEFFHAEWEFRKKASQ